MPPGSNTLPPQAQKRRYVRDMFSAIAPTYDFLNHLLTLNLDRRWRRRAVERLGWRLRPRGLFLDACSGTLDLALALAEGRGFEGRVVAADFALPMLERGAQKAGAQPVRPAAADALELPFKERTFDGVTVGWGIRNLADLEAGFAELLRVLKDGARLVVIDSTMPPPSVLRPLYLLYFRRVVPAVGRAISGHPTAYAYLPSSVGAFPAASGLLAGMERAGLRSCGFEPLAGGNVTILWGER
jgi:demethylmenaquinone methyltransferase/2-methoxy-6-polyprenyl-1,4-benzoquinol methylase